MPEHLTAKLFGVTIEEGDHQVVTYRKMVRLGLVFSSDTETVPSSLKGLPDTESLNQPYSTYTNMLDAMLHGLHGNRSNFQESAVKAASSVQSAYAFFLTTQKLAETEIIEVPRNDDGSFDTSGFEDE